MGSGFKNKTIEFFTVIQNMKIEIFKKQKHFQKGGFHTNPDICWEIVMYVAFAIVLAVLVFGYYLFGQIDKGFSIEGVDTNAQAKLVNKDRIGKVLQYFTQREEKSMKILNSPSPIVDPSL